LNINLPEAGNSKTNLI